MDVFWVNVLDVENVVLRTSRVLGVCPLGIMIGSPVVSGLRAVSCYFRACNKGVQLYKPQDKKAVCTKRHIDDWLEEEFSFEFHKFE